MAEDDHGTTRDTSDGANDDRLVAVKGGDDPQDLFRLDEHISPDGSTPRRGAA